MMITTIQIHEKTKSELDSIKREKETYEEIIVRLIDSEEKQKRLNKNLLIEGYKEMAEDNLKTTKEWVSTESKQDWTW